MIALRSLAINRCGKWQACITSSFPLTIVPPGHIACENNVRNRSFWGRTIMRGRLGLAGLALLMFGAGLAQAEPLKIRGAWVAPIANWSSLWLQKKDLAVHFGQSYVFEPVRYAGTPPMITAIANNELEIGNLAFSTLPIAIENAGMDDIRVISDDFQDGANGYYSNEFDVLADGPIKKIEDLKGKIVATNSAGAGVDVAMRAML